jgi:hypothetical protein
VRSLLIVRWLRFVGAARKQPEQELEPFRRGMERFQRGGAYAGRNSYKVNKPGHNREEKVTDLAGLQK